MAARPFQLEVRRSTARGEETWATIRFDQDEVLVGRSPEAHLCLPHPEVSGFHCSILRQEGDLLVKDRGSENGTWLSGQRLSVGELAAMPVGVGLGLGPFSIRLLALETVGSDRTPGPTAATDRRGTSDGGGAGGHLEVTAGMARGLRLMIRPAVGTCLVIGRGEEADLRLSDEEASRRHIELRQGTRGLEARDLGSKNGLRIDGRRIRGWARLTDGCRLRLGSTELTVHAIRGSGPGEPPALSDPPRHGTTRTARARYLGFTLILGMFAALAFLFYFVFWL